MRLAAAVPVVAAAVALAGCGGSSSGAAGTPPASTTSAAAPTPQGTPDPACRQPTSAPATAASYAATRLLSLSWLTITAQLSLARPLVSARYFPSYQSEIQKLQPDVLSTKTVESFAVRSLTYVSGDCTVPVYRVVGVQTSKRGTDPTATSTITLKEAMLLQDGRYVVDEVQSGT